MFCSVHYKIFLGNMCLIEYGCVIKMAPLMSGCINLANTGARGRAYIYAKIILKQWENLINGPIRSLAMGLAKRNIARVSLPIYRLAYNQPARIRLSLVLQAGTGILKDC